MRVWQPDTQRSDWPPIDPVDLTAIELTSTASAANSSPSITEIEEENRAKRLDSWLQKKGKVFHDTPMLDYRISLEEAGTTGGPRRKPGDAGGPTHECPPSVIRGANSQASRGYVVQVDWLRVSGPRAQRHAALRLLEAFFGKSEPGKGRYFLSCGDRIGDCGVYYDDPASGEKAAEHMVVDISGGMLSELESNDLVHQLTHELYALGCSATRIDIAVDFDDQPDLIETAYQACKQGKLAGAKCFRIVESENARGSDGRTLYIGKRGKMGSGRMLRVYDKGLETRTKDAGEWVRWEAEYTHDCARQVGDAYARADDPVKCLLQHAFGVCDFKEDPDEKNLSRRPRCKWFEKLVGLIDPSTVRAERAASTIYSKVRWFKDAVAPMLRTVQRVTGADLDRIVHEITGQVQTKPNKLHEPFVRGLCNSLGVPQLNIVSAYWNSPIRV